LRGQDTHAGNQHGGYRAAAAFPVHLDFLGTDRYGLENLNNLDKIPPRGALAYIGLIPFQAGSGGPSRVIASWSVSVRVEPRRATDLDMRQGWHPQPAMLSPLGS